MTSVVALRDYQREALEAIEREHASCRSTLIVLATGLGKTTVFVEWLRRRVATTGARALVIAHREELIAQAVARIKAQAPELTVGVEMAESRSSALMPEQVIVGSVQTLSRPARLAAIDPMQFASIVIDEAHHATARSYRTIIDHLPLAQVLGVTATPDRGDETALGTIFESCAYEMDMLAGIERGYLAPIRVRRIVADRLDLSRVRVRGGDLAADDLDKLMAVEGVLHQIAAPLAKEAGSRQTIVFTPGVQAAHGLADVLRGYRPHDRVEAIDGTTPRDRRAAIIDAFRAGELWAIVNCAVLTEGFDAPATSCIAMARPTKSRALYAQCVGRGTRLHPGKEDLLVLDFAGRSEDMSLCTPVDVLGGRPLDEREAARARRLSREHDVVTARKLAIEQTAAERAEEQRREAERRRENERRLARITADVRYAARDVDPWRAVAGNARRGEAMATDAQRAALERFGVDMRDLSKSQASRLISELVRRSREGLATYKQARWLAKNGYPDSISREEASRIMSAWAANGWRRPDGDAARR